MSQYSAGGGCCTLSNGDRKNFNLLVFVLKICTVSFNLGLAQSAGFPLRRNALTRIHRLTRNCWRRKGWMRRSRCPLCARRRAASGCPLSASASPPEPAQSPRPSAAASLHTYCIKYKHTLGHSKCETQWDD